MSQNQTPEEPRGNGRVAVLLIMAVGLLTAIIVLVSVLSLKKSSEQQDGSAPVIVSVGLR